MSVQSRLSSALSDRYVLESELGQGGMATVYLAQDLKHDRKVAVKVLRPELAAVIGADRFLTEIKTTANLQHPHILPLFDSGAADGFLFYVMPWVQGETVRDRITREKQLPIADALRITTEVAAALDYAHRHGVIHRDIKPENILLHDGSALVADFGIALAASKAGGSTRMTETGMSLGTPHYMSPEQAMGEREITARSDVYALGCVLYEMLTGDPPFTGSTAQAIVARVVTEAPRPMVPQRHTIPPYVEAAVLTALEKLPADRFASAKEFADALDGKNSRYAATVLAPGARPSRLMRLTRPVMISALALTATAAGLAGWLLHEGGRADAPVSRYPVSFPEPKTPDGPMAFTADGSRLVYRGPADTNGVQLWLKDRDVPEATPIPGTANAIDFAISPDGRSLAVLVDGRLERMPIAGGPVTVLTDSAAIAAIGPVWLDDDTIIYSSRNFRLMRIAAGGGVPTVLYTPDSSIAGAAFPAPLPDGRGVLFLRCSVSCLNTDLAVLDFKSGKVNVILTGARRAWYLPSGHLVFVNGTGDLFAADFDLKTRQVRGSPVQVQRGVSSPDGFAPAAAISGNGTLLLRQGNTPQGRAVPYELVWVDRAGQQVAIDPAWTFRHSAGGGNVGWSLSPDGRQVAIGLNTNSGDDVWLKRIPTGPPTRLTFDSTNEQRPRWTPDGQSVTYIVVADSSLHQRRADGTGADRNLVRVPGKLITAGAWSPDGKWLVIRTGGIDQQVGGRDIVGIRPGIDTAPVPLAASPRFDEAGPMVSPDGKWLAYESDETGRTEVYIRPFPNVDDGRWQVSLNGGQSPLWAHNRKEIFFVDAERNLVAVPIMATAPLQLGERNVLFRMGPELFLTNAEHYTPFDISLDDKRFLMARRVRSATEPPSFLLVENWFTELKSKVATK